MRIFWSALLLVVMGDWLLFGSAPGISISYYGVIVMLAVLANRPAGGWDRMRVLGIVLVLGALIQTAVEPNFFNAVILAALALLGAVADAARRTSWARIGSLAVYALARIPIRFPAYFELFREARDPEPASAWGRKLSLASRLALPAFAVAIPFALLFSSGNAIFHVHLQALENAVQRLFAGLSLPSPGRFAFWMAVLTCALAVLLPAIPAAVSVSSRQVFPETALTRWRTWTILAVLNALFLWTNLLDVLFLWFHQALPVSVSYSHYVHEGVASLIAATILSAVTLLVIYRDRGGADGSAVTRVLAFLWILQNWVLLAGVTVRLKLYVQAYDLSVLRFHVGTFLLLVAVGFALLGWRILDGKTLRWLVGANALATLSLFYALQFVDVKAIVARYNTDRFLSGATNKIDLRYLVQLGSAGWPQLDRLKRQASRWDMVYEAKVELNEAAARLANDPHTGRGWQYRWAARKKALFPNLPQDALLLP